MMKFTTLSIKNWIVISLILIPVIGLVVFWRAHQQTVNKKTPVFEAERGFQIEADELSKLNIKVPGKDKNSYWELSFAKFIDLGEYGGLDTVEGEYFQNSKPVYRITAPSGTIHRQSQVLRFYSPGAVSFDGGKELSADEMLWEPKNQKISAKGKVVLKINDLVVRTGELESDFQLNRIVLKGMTNASLE